jgi:hypothetical protein
MLDDGKEVIPEAMAALDEMALMLILLSANLFWQWHLLKLRMKFLFEGTLLIPLPPF